MSNPIVQVAHATGSTGATPVTPPSSVTAGNALLIGISHAGAASMTFTSVVDSAGGTVVTLSAYTQVQPGGSGYNGIGWYLIQSAVAGSHTITVNTSAVSCTVFVAELSTSILGGTLSIDLTSAIADGSGTTSVSAATNALIPTTGDLLLALDNVQETSTLGTWANGFTQADLSGSTAWSYLVPSSNSSINTSITLTASAMNWAAQLIALKVTPSGSPAATPTFSPVAGSYASAQSVTISCSTPSSTIYYTTDGSTPTTSSTVYTSAITVSVTETVKAIATASGYTQSAVGSAAYTITGTTPTISSVNGGSSIAEGATAVPVVGTNFASGMTAAITQGTVSVAQSPIGFTASTTPFTVATGSTGPANLLDPFGSTALTDTVTAIHRTDWEGRQLLYPTARTNVQPYSNTFGLAYHSQPITVTTGQADPMGGATATNFAWTVGAATFLTSNPATETFNSGTVVTMQIFINFAGIPDGTGILDYYVGDGMYKYGVGGQFDLAGGVPDARGGGAITLQSVANGFYLLTVTFTLTGATSDLTWIFTSSNTVPSANVTLFGRQILVGTVGGTYIPTPTASPVTVTDYVDNGNGTISLGVAATAGDTWDWDGTGTVHVLVNSATSADFNLYMEPGSGDQLAFTDATYVTDLTVTTTSGTSTGVGITLTPPNGQIFQTLASINATSAYRFTATPDLVVGDQVEGSGSADGTAAAPAGLSFNSDGTFSWASGATITNFWVRAYDSTNATPTWGAWKEQATSLAPPGYIVHWFPIEFACRMRSLQQGALNVGNTRQNIANLKALAVAEANGAAGWAKWDPIFGYKLLVWPVAVPGYTAPPAI